MTIDRLALEYSLSAKDRVRVQDCLNRVSSRSEDPIQYFLTHRFLMPIVFVFLGYQVIDWLLRTVPRLFSSDRAELLQSSEVTGHLFGVFVIWILGYNAWHFAAGYRGREKSRRAGREGVNWGRHHLSATPEALTIELAAHSAVYRWAAFSELEKTKRMLLLSLAPRSAVAIPRDAFPSGAEEQAFCDFVERQISGT